VLYRLTLLPDVLQVPALDPDDLLLTEPVLMVLHEMGVGLLTLDPRRPPRPHRHDEALGPCDGSAELIRLEARYSLMPVMVAGRSCSHRAALNSSPYLGWVVQVPSRCNRSPGLTGGRMPTTVTSASNLSSAARSSTAYPVSLLEKMTRETAPVVVLVVVGLRSPAAFVVAVFNLYAFPHPSSSPPRPLGWISGNYACSLTSASSILRARPSRSGSV
jgi:hypothetical protein